MSEAGISIAAKLDRLAAQPGVQGCALVDASTGMIWQASPQAESNGQLWEAAVEYWRVHKRQSRHFAVMGSICAIATHHTCGVLVAIPCTDDPELLLIVAGNHRGVDWRAIQGMVGGIGEVVLESK